EGGGMSVRSGSAAYSRAERFLRFERGMQMNREGQIITADAATAFLLPDRDEPRIVELRNNASIQGPPAGSALQNMRARDMNLTYGEDGRTLQHVLLVGASELQIASATGGATQHLQSET